MTAAGRKVIAGDIDPQRRGFLPRDFLTAEPPPGIHGGTLITNPPFGDLGDQFLRRTIRSWPPSRAMLGCNLASPSSTSSLSWS